MNELTDAQLYVITGVVFLGLSLVLAVIDEILD